MITRKTTYNNLTDTQRNRRHRRHLSLNKKPRLPHRPAAG
jgi:hypothetical protein